MIIKNGIVADPASGLYEQMDILVKDGNIVKIAPDISCASDAAATEKEEIIDAAGMIVGPGLIDTHVHFRDPGFIIQGGYPHRFPVCRKGWLHNRRVHGKHKAYSGQCGYSKGTTSHVESRKKSVCIRPLQYHTPSKDRMRLTWQL